MHCTSGWSRCSAVIIVYLCLFIKHPNWSNPLEVHQWVLQNYPQGLPNINAVIQAIKNHKYIQDEELERQNRINVDHDKERLRKLALEEEERLRLQKLADNERLRKMQEEEKERLRQLKIKEDELIRLRKLQEQEAEKLRL